MNQLCQVNCRFRIRRENSLHHRTKFARRRRPAQLVVRKIRRPAVHLHHFVIFFVIEVSEPLDDDIERPPSASAADVLESACDLRANEIRQVDLVVYHDTRPRPRALFSVPSNREAAGQRIPWFGVVEPKRRDTRPTKASPAGRTRKNCYIELRAYAQVTTPSRLHPPERAFDIRALTANDADVFWRLRLEALEQEPRLSEKQPKNTAIFRWK